MVVTLRLPFVTLYYICAENNVYFYAKYIFFPGTIAKIPESCYNRNVTLQNLISRPVLLSPVRAGGKRETGANPVRTRHCKRGVVDIFCLFSGKVTEIFSGRLVAQ